MNQKWCFDDSRHKINYCWKVLFIFPVRCSINMMLIHYWYYAHIHLRKWYHHQVNGERLELIANTENKKEKISRKSFTCSIFTRVWGIFFHTFTFFFTIKFFLFISVLLLLNFCTNTVVWCFLPLNSFQIHWEIILRIKSIIFINSRSEFPSYSAWIVKIRNKVKWKLVH